MAQNWLDDAFDSVNRRMREAGKEPIGYRKNGRPIWPIFGAEDQPAPTPPPAPAPAPAPQPEFPANTPVAQMTEGQQVAYWKHYARQHEDRSKAFGDLTPEKLAELQEKATKHDELQLELGTTADQAAAKAAKEAEEKTRGEMQPKLVETAFRIAIGERKTADEVADFIADTNLSRFLTTTGEVDTAKVLARVEQFAPATGTPQQTPRGPVVTPHTSPGGSGPVKPGDGARAALAARGIKID